MTIPSFVQPGFEIQFTSFEETVGETSSGGAEGVVFETVLSVSAASASERVISYPIGEPIEAITENVSFAVPSSSAWLAQFWVDPNNPAGSIVGPDGEIFSSPTPETYDSSINPQYILSITGQAPIS
jgi:hypothetical protein